MAAMADLSFCFLVVTVWLSLFSLTVEGSGKEGWTCEADGFWYENGEKSIYDSCNETDKGKKDDSGKKGDKAERCTVTSMSTSAMNDAMKSLTHTCIAHTSHADGRCWWTHVPSAVASATDGRKVPLLVDMHGGGGCAYDRFSSSGFKALSDTISAKVGEGLIVVWPQGGQGGQWASTGTSTRDEAVKAGKNMPEWDDLGFLEQLIANMVKSSPHKDKIDPERVYMSGFSMGCMMTNRFALERGEILAAFGCHGGDLSLAPVNQVEMDADKAQYSIQPMPAFLSIGSEDAWYDGARRTWRAWAYWNSCSRNGTANLTEELEQHTAFNCTEYTPTLQTIMLVIKGGKHVPADTRVAQETWDFVSRYKRSGVLDRLPEAVPDLSPLVSHCAPFPTVSAVVCAVVLVVAFEFGVTL